MLRFSCKQKNGYTRAVDSTFAGGLRGQMGPESKSLVRILFKNFFISMRTRIDKKNLFNRIHTMKSILQIEHSGRGNQNNNLLLLKHFEISIVYHYITIIRYQVFSVIYVHKIKYWLVI